MAYSFRNRFKYDGVRFGSDAQEYVLAEPPSEDGRVVLQALKPDQAIKDTNELILQGSGYADFDSAAAAGRRWRHYLSVAMARDRKAVDFGDDDESQLAPIWDQMAGPDDQILPDRHGLLVFPTWPPATYVRLQARGEAPPIAIGQFVDGALQTARATSHVPFGHRQNLCLRACAQRLGGP